MQKQIQIPTYVGATVSLTSDAAAEAFVLTVLEAVLLCAPADRSVVMRFPTGTLRLEGPGERPPVPPRAGAWWPFWRAQGTLRPRRLAVRVPVEIELVPHSDDRIEVGLRPRRPGVITRLLFDPARYQRSAAEVVHLISTSMSAHRPLNDRPRRTEGGVNGHALGDAARDRRVDGADRGRSRLAR